MRPTAGQLDSLTMQAQAQVASPITGATIGRPVPRGPLLVLVAVGAIGLLTLSHLLGSGPEARLAALALVSVVPVAIKVGGRRVLLAATDAEIRAFNITRRLGPPGLAGKRWTADRSVVEIDPRGRWLTYGDDRLVAERGAPRLEVLGIGEAGAEPEPAQPEPGLLKRPATRQIVIGLLIVVAFVAQRTITPQPDPAVIVQAARAYELDFLHGEGNAVCDQLTPAAREDWLRWVAFRWPNGRPTGTDCAAWMDWVSAAMPEHDRVAREQQIQLEHPSVSFDGERADYSVPYEGGLLHIRHFQRMDGKWLLSDARFETDLDPEYAPKTVQQLRWAVEASCAKAASIVERGEYELGPRPGGFDPGYAIATVRVQAKAAEANNGLVDDAMNATLDRRAAERGRAFDGARIRRCGPGLDERQAVDG